MPSSSKKESIFLKQKVDLEKSLYYNTNEAYVHIHMSYQTVECFGGREISMSNTTRVRKNESLEDALRRFKRSVSKSGTISEYRKREFYEKPSVRRKKKSEAARKRK